MVSTHEEFTYNSPMSPSQSVIMKNTIVRIPLRQFFDTLKIKPKTAIRKVSPINQSAEQSELAVFWGLEYQSETAI